MVDWEYMMEHCWPDEVYDAYNVHVMDGHPVPVDVIAYLESKGYQV